MFKKGQKGELYNICTGKGSAIKEVIAQLAQLLDLEITQQVNPALVRPSDNRIIIGTHQKITEHTGWKPNYSLKDSLKEILNGLHNL